MIKKSSTNPIIISLLVSIVYFPLMIIGKVVGDASIYYIDVSIIRGSFAEELLYLYAPIIIPYIIGGLIAGIIVVRYISSNKFVSSIIPAIFTVPVVLYTYLSLLLNFSSYRPLLYVGDGLIAFKLGFVFPLVSAVSLLWGYGAYYLILFLNDPNDSKIEKEIELVSSESVLTEENTEGTYDHDNNKIRIPDLGSDVSFAMISQWLKEPGDKVEKEESVVVIETDKVTIDLVAPISGVIEKVYYPQGSKVTVGDIICKLR